MYDRFPAGSIVVQKYGGTSVANEERILAIAKRISEQVNQGWTRTAIVVSAMSGETNRLVKLVSKVNPRASAKNYDMAVSAGEQISVALMAAALESYGVFAKPMLAFQAGIRTDRSHARAKILSIQGERIHECWENHQIPIIAGFQGITPELEVTTLGRGGSDISAVALAVALKAKFCEINTDVDGVFTADPRFVKDASLIENLDYETALELAALGGKVLHSRCVELAAKHQLPLVVRNSYLPSEARRTHIMPMTESERLEAPMVSGVTLEQDIAKITVRDLPKIPTAVSDIFKTIAEAGVNVDIIVQNKQKEEANMRLGFTVAKSELPQALEAIESLKKRTELAGLSSTFTDELSKVSIVGLGMRAASGVASQMFSVLSENEIDIRMISTSEIKVSCVVPQEEGKKAAELLHTHFFKGPKIRKSPQPEHSLPVH